MNDYYERQNTLLIHLLIHSIVILVWCIVSPPWETGDYRYLFGYIIGLVLFNILLTMIRRYNNKE